MMKWKSGAREMSRRMRRMHKKGTIEEKHR
jgi:hypothetical protein